MAPSAASEPKRSAQEGIFMEDLIERAKKYAKGAGWTGLGHYDAAHKSESKSKWLVWLNVTLSAIVGASVFSKLVQEWPILTGAIALTAAAVGAIQASSKLADNSERHRVAGARYGRLRRLADMLKLKAEGNDIDRKSALTELEMIGEELSKLAKESLSLPDSIYYPAKSKFDKDHPEYILKSDLSDSHDT